MAETTDQLDASDPVGPVSGCNQSYWLEGGIEPSLAVDGAGQPRIGYNAIHYSGGSCTVQVDLWLSRYAQFGNATPPASKYQAFLPALTKE